MVMIRYNLCSIYHGGAYSSLEKIFLKTKESYGKNFKEAPSYIQNLQITFKYFREGFEPLNRLANVYGTLEELLSNSSEGILDMKKDVFLTVKDLIGCNLAYLKL